MSDMEPIDIGYLCRAGHYCFTADPEEAGQCGSKDLGRIMFVPDPDLELADDPWLREVIEVAQASLAEKFDAWRRG